MPVFRHSHDRQGIRSIRAIQTRLVLQPPRSQRPIRPRPRLPQIRRASNGGGDDEVHVIRGLEGARAAPFAPVRLRDYARGHGAKARANPCRQEKDALGPDLDSAAMKRKTKDFHGPVRCNKAPIARCTAERGWRRAAKSRCDATVTGRRRAHGYMPRACGVPDPAM